MGSLFLIYTYSYMSYIYAITGYHIKTVSFGILLDMNPPLMSTIYMYFIDISPECVTLRDMEAEVSHTETIPYSIIMNGLQRTTISTLFSRLQVFSGMRSQKKLLARQTLTYSRQQLANRNIQSPRSQV